MVHEMEDDLEALEAKETAGHIPAGYWVLFFGLIAWGIYYLWAYTPFLGGWSQAGELAQSSGAAGGSGVNIFAAILFTALAAVAVAAIAFFFARGRKGR